MINVVRINELGELMTLILDQPYKEDIKRNRSQYVYRGVNNVDFKMETSLYRNCKGLQKNLEPSILANFTKYACLEDPSVEKSVWRQMILGQHHGLPTRLLDWTHSALIGLHFAVTEDNMDKMEDADCVLWKIDMKEIHSLLPIKYKKVLEESATTVFSVDKLSRVTESLEQYDRDMGESAMVVIEPPSIEQRIVNQYSFFTVVPMGISDIEEFLDRYTVNTTKFIINRNLRWRICDMLDQLNISERIIYPGLDGLSEWIARHYYVREDIK